jgi:hypothetical protein
MTEFEIEGATLALRLLSLMLVDSGAIDPDVSGGNREKWIEIIKSDTDKSADHREAVSLVFAHILGAKPDAPFQLKFTLITGGKSE